jgi:hypothetical protein
MCPKKLGLINDHEILNFDNIFELCENVAAEKVPPKNIKKQQSGGNNLPILASRLASKLELYNQQLTNVASFAPLYDSR